MDGSYGTYVDDECIDNHDYDDDTDDNNDHKKDSYTAAGAAPDAGAAPTHTRPDQTRPKTKDQGPRTNMDLLRAWMSIL